MIRQCAEGESRMRRWSNRDGSCGRVELGLE